MKFATVLILAAIPAAAQFQIQVVDASGVHPSPAVYDLGSGYAGDILTTRFQLRNNSAAVANVLIMTLAGVGFSLNAPLLPVQLDPQSSLEFTVSFRSADLGSYSAVLRAENVTILLTAAIQPRLTLRADGGTLGNVIDFGSVLRGSSVLRQVTLANETPVVLTVPAIYLNGVDFAFAGSLPSGIRLSPGQTASFAIDFAPAFSGNRMGTLTVGNRSLSLSGTGIDPPWPKPMLAIDLAQPASAQQGLLLVNFDRPSSVSGSGTASLDFRGSADPTVAFAAGGRQVVFPVAPGDTQVAIPFQTGTTAGTLLFNVRMGDAADSASIQIPTYPPVLNTVLATRSVGNMEVRVLGYDNTHSLSQFTFTFFDGAEKEIVPGGIRAGVSSEFARYFGESDVGGTFLLRANFPVTGDALQIAAVEISATDLIGTTKSARIPIQ